MAPRPCIACGRLTTHGARCADHQLHSAYETATHRVMQAEARAKRGQPCPTCNKPMTYPEAHHVLAPSQGQSNRYLIVCRACNRSHRLD